MSTNGVSAVSDVNAAQGTSKLKSVNGKPVINFKGKKYELTPKQVEQYNELWAALSSEKMKVAELQQELAKTTDPDDKRELKDAIAVHTARYAEQVVAATFDIVPVGKEGMEVVFKMKKNMSAEDFKRVFNLEEGALRPALKLEAFDSSSPSPEKIKGYVEACWASFSDETFMDYDTRTGKMKDVFFETIEYNKKTGCFFETSNGVKLINSDDDAVRSFFPHCPDYVIDYSDAKLSAGREYRVASDGVVPKPWYQFW